VALSGSKIAHSPLSQLTTPNSLTRREESKSNSKIKSQIKSKVKCQVKSKAKYVPVIRAVVNWEQIEFGLQLLRAGQDRFVDAFLSEIFVTGVTAPGTRTKSA
jgi:hypothetical protein